MNAIRKWLDEQNFASDDARRILALLITSALVGLFVLDWAGPLSGDDLAPGMVAPRTVKASHTFQYTDKGKQQNLADQARTSVLPVFVYRADLADDTADRVRAAFTAGRGQLVDGHLGPDGPQRTAAIESFRAALGVSVPDEDVTTLLAAGAPPAAEDLAVGLLRRGMSGYVVADRAEMPSGSALRVIELRGEGQEEVTLTDLSLIHTPADARERVTMGLVESDAANEPWAQAAATVARAVVRPNLSFDALETRHRADTAASQVPAEVESVKRGTILFREGDVLTDNDVERYRALQRTAAPRGPFSQWLTVSLFVGGLSTILYQFGSTWFTGFSTKARDAAATGVLLVLVALMARIVTSSADGVSALIGMEAQASSVWFIVPVAGATMLVRLLVGPSFAMPFAIAASTVCGLMMELDALHVVFFVVSSLVASGSVDHTRERMTVLRAGAFAGLVNAATVLIVHFVVLLLGDGEIGLAVTMRPVWSMLFAFAGGLLSGFLVLGLMPLFEWAGFVTDYRLMELANLNHPLMRQLMLRAPGSYHHSVVVGQLAEAACEAIGANALQARVAAYFHDIGKANKPQYFVENQRGANRHEQLDPNQSAKVIIAHVTDGLKMAKEHGLPKPIVDNIAMHHGTGLLQYFWVAARNQAEDPDSVDEATFRYPGPKPDTRESGVIMLADKVEAATRTIKEPNEERIRAMIQQIINSVIADGQFEHCPLTFQELYTIAETFVKVLVAIHHQRIEYPSTRAISSGEAPAKPAEAPAAMSAPPRKAGSIITLEIPAQKPTTPPEEEDDTDPITDYESVNNLPSGRSGNS